MKTRSTILAVAAIACAGYAFHLQGQDKPAVAKKDAAASKAAFKEVYKVLMHPRCMNCHPAGSAPLQGEDSHPHTMNVKAGPEGKGSFAMKCTNCHQEHNLPGENMPPGNPTWHLPPRETPMVFEGRTAAQLAAQIKDPKQNGGKTLEQIYHHMAEDELVGWGWAPGDGRTPVPVSREEFAKQVRTWIDNGAEVPD